jgi:transposase
MQKTTRLLGKITEKDGFVPSSKNELRKEYELLPKIDIKTYGISALFESLLPDEIASLQLVFGKETADALLSFALMRWAYQSPIKRLANYHSHDFCSETWSSERLLSDKKITAVLKSVGENRDGVIRWMKTLLPENAAETKNFILMDSTHAMSASDGLAINVPGYNPSFDFGKQIRLMYMFSQNLKEPIYYRLLNGNIPDISSMSLCFKEIGLSNVILVADKDFYSEENMKDLDSGGVQYIVPLRRSNSAVNYNPLLQADFKKTNEFFIYQKRIIWYYQYENAGKKYVTFLDERLRVEEEQDYLQRMQEKQEKYTKENYNQGLHKFGTLTIAYSATLTQSAEQLYGIYKQRNEIETMFDAYKNFLEADKTYMQNRFVLEGWLFVNFLAMIAYYKLFDRLRSAKLLYKYSPKDIIENAKAIYQVRIRGIWHRSEITKKVKEVFTKIKINRLT